MSVGEVIRHKLGCEEKRRVFLESGTKVVDVHVWFCFFLHESFLHFVKFAYLSMKLLQKIALLFVIKIHKNIENVIVRLIYSYLYRFSLITAIEEQIIAMK